MVHESGEGGIHLHGGEASGGLAEDASIAIGDDGDDDGIGAGEVLGVAARALAHQAAASHFSGIATTGAELVGGVPSEVGASLGEDASFGAGDDHCGFAGVAELEAESGGF